jgi:hypothetical protein
VATVHLSQPSLVGAVRRLRPGRPRVGCGDAWGPRIIEALNDVLTAELTAVNQYFIHAKMSSNWGYRRRGAHVRDESIDEMRHAERIIDRILYFDGTPNMQRLSRCGWARPWPSSWSWTWPSSMRPSPA